MSFRDAYFDTEVFSYFLFNMDSQKNLNFHPIEGTQNVNISYIVIEEFIHQMKDENWDKWTDEYESFDEVWLEFEKKKAVFQNTSVDTGELMNQYQRVITKLSRGSKGEFESSSLDSMDVLHLCIAEIKSCRKIYTLDGGFNTEDLKKISKLFENVKKVIILNYNGDKLEKDIEKRF